MARKIAEIVGWAAAVAAVLVGCSDGPDLPPRATASSSGAAAVVEPRPDGLTVPTCDQGEVRECTLVLSVHGNVVNCVTAVEYCVDGRWSECGADTPGEFLPSGVTDAGNSADAPGRDNDEPSKSVR